MDAPGVVFLDEWVSGAGLVLWARVLLNDLDFVFGDASDDRDVAVGVVGRAVVDEEVVGLGLGLAWVGELSEIAFGVELSVG